MGGGALHNLYFLLMRLVKGLGAAGLAHGGLGAAKAHGQVGEGWQPRGGAIVAKHSPVAATVFALLCWGDCSPRRHAHAHVFLLLTLTLYKGGICQVKLAGMNLVVGFEETVTVVGRSHCQERGE